MTGTPDSSAQKEGSCFLPALAQSTLPLTATTTTTKPKHNTTQQQPSQLRRFNGEAGQALVEEPDADVFVFCRVDADCGAIPDGPNGETAELNAGDVLNIRYAHIAHLVEGGQVHLI